MTPSLATVVTNIDITIARFLATPEDPEASDPRKPEMEPECLRTAIGRCHHCGNEERPIFRYEIDPRHLDFLTCLCEEWITEGLCEHCKHGVPGFAPDVACWDGPCYWSLLLAGEDGPMPWLCPSCWRDAVAEEQQHIQELEGAIPT